MKPKHIALWVILLILGGVVYLDDYWTKSEEKDKKQANLVLKPFDDSQIEKIDYLSNIQDGDKKEPIYVVLLKKDSFFTIAQPIPYKADKRVVDSILKSLKELKYLKKISKTDNKLEEFGLKNPIISISIADKKGNHQTLKIGNKAPIGYSRYAKLKKSQDVFLVSDSIYMASNKKLFDFRDKSLTNLPYDKIIHFTYQDSNGVDLQLEKTSDKWQYSDGIPLDKDEVFDFISQINSETVTRIIDAPSTQLQEAYSPNNPSSSIVSKIKAKFSDQKEKSLTILTVGEDLFAFEDKAKRIFQLPKNSKNNFVKKNIDFRDRKLLNFDSDKVSKVIIDHKTFVKKEDSWRLLKKDNSSGPEVDRIRLLLIDLEFAKADEFLPLDEKPYEDISKAFSKVKLFFDDKKRPPVTIHLFEDLSDKDKKFLVRHTEGSFLFKITKNVLSNLKEKEVAHQHP